MSTGVESSVLKRARISNGQAGRARDTDAAFLSRGWRSGLPCQMRGFARAGRRAWQVLAVWRLAQEPLQLVIVVQK